MKITQQTVDNFHGNFGELIELITFRDLIYDTEKDLTDIKQFNLVPGYSFWKNNNGTFRVYNVLSSVPFTKLCILGVAQQIVLTDLRRNLPNEEARNVIVDGYQVYDKDGIKVVVPLVSF